MNTTTSHVFNAPLQKNKNTMLKRDNTFQKQNKIANERNNSDHEDEEKDL